MHNNTIGTLLVVNLTIGAGLMFLVLFGKKTVQLTSDSSGTLHTGEIKQHVF